MKGMWIVVDITTGKVDGYYANRDGECSAKEVADWWASEHPSHNVVVAQIFDTAGKSGAIPENTFLANSK